MSSARRTRIATRESRSTNIRVSFGPTFAVLAAAALFGTTGTALARGPNGIQALPAGTLRLLIGGAGLCLIAGRTLIDDLRAVPVSRHVTVLIGGGAVAVYQLGFFWATQATGVALATVVTIGTSPLVARLIAAVRGRPAPDIWWAISAFGLIVGLTLLVVGSSQEDSLDVDLLGVLAALLAGAAYATYTEVGSVMMARGWRPTSAMAAIFFAAGLMTSPILATRDLAWLGRPAGLVVILYLSLVTLSLAYIGFGWGLKRLPPTTVVMLTMFEPVVAACLAIVVLDERFTGISWVGIAIALTGLVTVGLRSRPAPPATVAT